MAGELEQSFNRADYFSFLFFFAEP